jgi:hypothetical protein
MSPMVPPIAISHDNLRLLGRSRSPEWSLRCCINVRCAFGSRAQAATHMNSLRMSGATQTPFVNRTRPCRMMEEECL